MSGNKHSSGMKLLALLMLIRALCTDRARNNAQLILINPYPATGVVDITGTVVMSMVLRAMQNQVTPSTTDALVQRLRQSLVDGLGRYVEVQRNPRTGGIAHGACSRSTAQHQRFQYGRPDCRKCGQDSSGGFTVLNIRSSARS